MSARTYIAILAHANRDCLEDLLDNIAHFVPDAGVIVFNGGRDEALTRGLDVEVCPLSRPLRLGNLVPFHAGVMEWLHRRGAPYDFLATIDSDMLFIRPGFTSFLDRIMADSGFMGCHFEVIDRRPWKDWAMGRRLFYTWDRGWEPLFGTELPAWSANAGMVFRRQYVDALYRFPTRERLMARAFRSRNYGIEELVWPTLAFALGCRPIRNPGSHGIHLLRLTVGDVLQLATDENVHFVHKTHMEIDSPERLAVRALREGRPPAIRSTSDLEVTHPYVYPTEPKGWTKLRTSIKDLYFRIFP